MRESEKIQEICELLLDAEDAILELEYETNVLYTCAIDEIMPCIERRIACQKEVEEIFARVQQICDMDASGMLQKAVENKTDYALLDADVRPIRDTRMRFNTAVHRILSIEPQILSRLTRERDLLLEKIKENNNGQSAAAAKFYGMLQRDEQSLFFPQRDKRI